MNVTNRINRHTITNRGREGEGGERTCLIDFLVHLATITTKQTHPSNQGVSLSTPSATVTVNYRIHFPHVSAKCTRGNTQIETKGSNHCETSPSLKM